VFDAIELCHKYNLANSMDLIYGWPEQTIENMLTDLKDAVSAGIHHLTHYELNVAGRSDFASPKKRALLPTIETNIEMYRIANEYLTSEGFEQVTVYDWSRKADTDDDVRKGSYDYEHSMHDFVDQKQGEIKKTRQVCGIGYSAVNFHPNGVNEDDRSWIYMNQTSLKDYCQDLDDGKFPVGRGFMYNHQDVKLAWIFQSMQTMSINHINYEHIFKESLLSAYDEVWNELQRRQWVSVNDVTIQFTGEGQYYIPMLQSLIASLRLEEIREQKKLSVKEIPVLVEASV
ncbi:MAG: radical SAM protein, partial [Gammaproteobacteria bacterium]|nr:radical SAM protein [Gammaproteobacteria bacterium]